MPESVWLRAILKALILPPASPLILAMLGLALMRRRPRLGTALAWSGVVLLALLALPIVASLLLDTVNATSVLDSEQAAKAEAIVILGGGVRRDAPEYEGDTLGRLTLERVRYGARVARRLDRPVLVTGGSVLGGTAEAVLMRQALEQEYGVKVRWVEDRSRNTHENALRSAAILQAAGIHRVVLVAHAFDMQRAVAEFSAAGLEAVPAATGLASREPVMVLDFLPSVAGLQGSYYALYELLANRVR